MPPRKKMKSPTTFDEHLAAVVESKRAKKKLTVEELAVDARMTYQTMRRRLDGAPFTVDEIQRVGAAVSVPSAQLIDEALNDYGGLAKLIAENTVSEAMPKLSDYRKVDPATAPESELMGGKRAAGQDPELEQDQHYD